MGTQLSSAKRGIFTEEMKQVAKDEGVNIDFIVNNVAKGSIIIPKNIARKQKRIKVDKKVIPNIQYYVTTYKYSKSI